MSQLVFDTTDKVAVLLQAYQAYQLAQTHLAHLQHETDEAIKAELIDTLGVIEQVHYAVGVAQSTLQQSLQMFSEEELDQLYTKNRLDEPALMTLKVISREQAVSERVGDQTSRENDLSPER